MQKHAALKRLGMGAVLITALPVSGGFTLPADCDNNGRVSVSELIVAVNVALGLRGVEACEAADANSDGRVVIGELIQGVNAALGRIATPTPEGTPGTPTETPTITPEVTRTPSEGPTGTKTPSVMPASPTEAVATPTRTPTATVTRTATRTPSRTPTRTPTRTAVAPPPADPNFRDVAVSAQAATRLGVKTVEWLAVVEQVVELAVAEPTDCPQGGSASPVQCSATAGGATLSVTYTACAEAAGGGNTLRRDGTVRVTVNDANACNGGAAVNGAAATVVGAELEGLRLRETSGGTTVLDATADLQVKREPVAGGTSCAGQDRIDRMTGSIDVQCAGAQSASCAAGIDAVLEPQDLEVERRSAGFPCKVTREVDGALGVADASSGEEYTEVFTELAIGGPITAAGSREVTLSGEVAADCLGAVTYATQEPLQIEEGGSCPVGGTLQIGRPTAPGAGTSSRFQIPNSKDGGLFDRGEDLGTWSTSSEVGAETNGIVMPGGGFRQYLFRSLAGQVYQVVQNDRSDEENGAERIRITTLVGALGEAVSQCANTVGESTGPTAVVATEPGRAFPIGDVVRSGVLNSAQIPCFNRNAEGGAGEVCVGSGCTPDCQCPGNEECEAFTIDEGENLASGSPAGGLRESIAAPQGRCSGLGGGETYGVGAGGPTTQQALCAEQASDGVSLESGQTIILAYDTQPLDIFNAGVGGFPIDVNGMNGLGCGGANKTLSPGRATTDTAAGATAIFTQNGAQLYYEGGQEQNAPDDTLDCEEAALLICDQPRPMPDPERPCMAEVLPSQDEVTIARSTGGADAANHVGGAPCGWGGGNTANDRVYEYEAPENGIYDIEVSNAELSPILTARRNDCRDPNMLEQVAAGETQPKQAACGSDAEGEGASQLTVELTKGDRIAIIVDGAGKTGGNFDLHIRRRQPDLQVTAIAAQNEVNAGEAVTVTATIHNSGDGDAGPFLVRFIFSRDAGGSEMLGDREAACTVTGLAAGGTTMCTASTALPVPLVGEGQYSIVATADSTDLVLESAENNNLRARAVNLHVVGAELEQEVFRATDGTTYQLLRVVPTQDPTPVLRYRVNAVAAANTGLVSCEQSVGSAVAFVGAPSLFPYDATRRSGVLQPNASEVARFDATASGILTLGAGSGVATVCADDASCAGRDPIFLIKLSAPVGGLPASCVSSANAFCGSGNQLGFGAAAIGTPPPCAAAATVSTPPCSLPPGDGFELSPGDAVVFVFDSGLEALSVGAGAFGVAKSTTGGCGPGQIIEGTIRREDTGQLPLLIFVDSVRPAGTPQPYRVATSPDGRHAYVSDRGGGIFVYAIASDQSLTLIEEKRQGVAGVQGIDGAGDVEVSGDGKFVYVAGTDENAIAVFSRNSTTGKLDEIEVQRDQGLNGLVQILGVSDLALSPDGAHLYAVSSGTRFPNPGFSGGYAVFQRDASTGRLTFQSSSIVGQGIPERAFAHSVTVSSDGANVYVASRDLGGTSYLVTYQRASGSGGLTQIDLVQSGVGGVPDFGVEKIEISGEGAFVYVPGVAGNVAAYFARDAIGALSFVAALPAAQLNGESVTFIALGAAPDTLYATTADRLLVFSRNPSNGGISFLQQIEDGVGGVEKLAGKGAVSVHSDGLLAVYFDDRAVSSFRRLGAGTLALASAIAIEPTVGGDVPAIGSLAVTPDGTDVYAGEAAGGGRVVLFDREPADGSLRLRSIVADLAVSGIDDISVSADGLSVVASSESSQLVVTLARDPGDGSLSIVSTAPRAPASGLSVCGGTPFVCYNATFNGIGVNVMVYEGARLLAFGDSMFDTDLLALRSIAINPRGTDAYFVTGVQFPNTGELIQASFTYVADTGVPQMQLISTSVAFSDATLPSLTGAREVVTSPFGKYVFVSGSISFGPSSGNPGSLTAFERVGASLEFRQAVVQGEGRVDGLGGADGVEVSPDGRNVYVLGGAEGSIAVFLLARPDD